jgi:D-arabinose 1-dehydrogenase-like Zn-dependent alcohol dehydrogenase
VLPKLVESIAKSKNITVGKIIADGAYDSNEIFRCLADNGIVPCIKVRRNVRVKKINHILRNLSESYLKEKRFIKMEGQSVSYGKRDGL